MNGYKKADKFLKDFKNLLFELGEDARLSISYFDYEKDKPRKTPILELTWKNRKTNKSVVVELAHTIYGANQSKQHKSYDLTIAEDLYNFSSDCEEATLECPQQTAWNPIDFDMGRNTVSPHEVFLYWRENNTLWNSGYNDCLSSKAKQTFSRYIMRETYDEDTEESLGVEVFDTVTNSTLSKETMNIFKFTTKEE